MVIRGPCALSFVRAFHSGTPLNISDVGTFTLFATHFQRLEELPRLYSNAKLWHLKVAAHKEQLDFTWQLQPGAGGNGHYGLVLARKIGFPTQVATAHSAG